MVHIIDKVKNIKLEAFPGESEDSFFYLNLLNLLNYT